MESRGLKIGTKIFTLIAHQHPLGQERHVVCHFPVVSTVYFFWYSYLRKLSIIPTPSKNIKISSTNTLSTEYNISGKPKLGEVIKNVQCGYDVRKDEYVSTNFILR